MFVLFQQLLYRSSRALSLSMAVVDTCVLLLGWKKLPNLNSVKTMWYRLVTLISVSMFTPFTWTYLTRLSVSRQKSYPDVLQISINDSNEKADDSMNLGFSLFELEQAKSREIEISKTYDITALLLHWKRLEGVKKTIKYLLDTNLFPKIILWNNNPQINLTYRHFTNNSRAKKRIRIINSKENLKDEAKYRACAEATTQACFYVDDDWDISRYIRSLIASFRSDPDVLHTVTDAYTFYTNLVWSFVDEAIDLHTGFSWIGCGGIFLRAHAERHLQLLRTYLKNQKGLKDLNISDWKSEVWFLLFVLALIPFSDVFFSIWLNDLPSQMNANIRYQPSKPDNGSLAFSQTARFAKLQYESSVLAIRILQQALRSKRAKSADDVTFSRQEKSRFPVYLKSPSVNDDFVFFSNILPFDSYPIPFNISKDFERGTRRNLPRDPNTRYFLSHSSLKAVDTDLSTCWYAHRDLREGDFFALDFLRVEQDVQFTLAVAHSSIMQMMLKVGISFDAVHWLSYRALQGRFIKDNRTSEEFLQTHFFDSAQFTPGFNSFRYLRFQAIKSSDHRFQICEIQKIARNKVNSLLQNFRPLSA